MLYTVDRLLDAKVKSILKSFFCLAGFTSFPLKNLYNSSAPSSFYFHASISLDSRFPFPSNILNGYISTLRPV